MVASSPSWVSPAATSLASSRTHGRSSANLYFPTGPIAFQKLFFSDPAILFSSLDVETRIYTPHQLNCALPLQG